MGKVLIVEDSEDMRFSLSNLVKKEGYPFLSASSGTEAINLMSSQIVDLVFLDIGLPDTDGIALIPKFMEIASDVDIVMLTGVNDAQTAVNALKAGALDYILKPFDITEFRHILHRTMKSKLVMRQSIVDSKDTGIDRIIGESNGIAELKKEIQMAADVKSPVLISGETGTGKELVARATYTLSEGSKGIFVKVDCGTLSSNIIESELFGHEKGAFTDAKSEKKGLIEMADGGTLFLDEIGNVPLELQPKLLRLVEESTFRRVGGLKDISTDVRIIAATNLDLEETIRKGNFREDLYYRLNVISLHIPPLRERASDILLLAHAFLRQYNAELRKQIKGLTREAEDIVLNYSWPGNVRELKNCIERAVIYCRGDWITPAELNIKSDTSSTDTVSFQNLVSLEQMERMYIQSVLSSVENNKTKAAQILGISRTTLREKLKET